MEQRLRLDQEVAASLASVFQQLARLIESDPAGLEHLSSVSIEASEFRSHRLNGRSAAVALCLVCRGKKAELGAMLFGAAEPEYVSGSDLIRASIGSKTLEFYIEPHVSHPEIAARFTPSAIVVQTNFSVFRFSRADKAGFIDESFMVMTSAELASEIDLVGSLWCLVFPSHFAVVSRTIAYSFPGKAKGRLFGDSLRNSRAVPSERTALDKLSCFCPPGGSLVSLDGLAQLLQSGNGAPSRLCHEREGSYAIRRYSPQRSPIFDYGEPQTSMTRGDFVTTYIDQEGELHREFIVMPAEGLGDQSNVARAMFDVLHTLAVRRSKLFRPAFARRVYNVLLPSIVIRGDEGEDCAYVLFPCITLYWTPKYGFRRTFSVSFVACPVSVTGADCSALRAREASLDELYEIKDSLLSPFVGQNGDASLQFHTSGAGQDYFDLSGKSSVSGLVHHCSKVILQRAVSGENGQAGDGPELAEILFAADQECRLATLLLLVDWKPPSGYGQPWERWLSGVKDPAFQSALFRTLFYWDSLNLASADASRHSIDFHRFMIGSTDGSDIGGMTLYNPSESLKVVLYPRRREQYPNFSLVRWMTWQIYIDSALTAQRALMFRFHPLLSERGYLHSLIDALDEMVQEFLDFYDLDLRDLLYRQEYEKMRSLMQIDADYKRLQDKFNEAKVDESLREQRLINKLVVALTVSTVTITVLSTIAQIQGAGSLKWYLTSSVVASAGVVLVGYYGFDPVRLVLERLVKGVAKLWH